MNDNSRTEADAARFAAIAGASEHIGNPVGDQEPDQAWAKALGPDPWDTRCVWCQGGEGDHWHRLCWAEAHDYFDDESEVR